MLWPDSCFCHGESHQQCQRIAFTSCSFFCPGNLCYITCQRHVVNNQKAETAQSAFPLFCLIPRCVFRVVLSRTVWCTDRLRRVFIDNKRQLLLCQWFVICSISNKSGCHALLIVCFWSRKVLSPFWTLTGLYLWCLGLFRNKVEETGQAPVSITVRWFLS